MALPHLSCVSMLLCCLPPVCFLLTFVGLFCYSQLLSSWISWGGKVLSLIASKGMTSLAAWALACFHCGDVATLLRDCECVAYYILIEGNKTRLLIHQGTHNHPVAKGVLRSAIKRTKTLVERVMSKAPTTGPRHMQLHLAKEMVLGSVIRENGGPLNNVELLSILEEMRPLVQSNRYFVWSIFIVSNAY